MQKQPNRDRIDALIFGGLILLIMAIVLQFSFYAIKKMPVESTPTSKPITTQTKEEVMIKTCFPKGNYKADAAFTCPALLQHLKKQLNESEEN